ncbi:MAG: hypothetical protein EHM15_12275 [Desulfobacteraceae bacterium]|nr:MAG: hypothetical protein EHM15_12275 [Desulfobacteraceae bacterium]
MPARLKPFDSLVDFVTGKPVPNIGAEENRQAVERLLVKQKGFNRGEIEVEVPIEMEVDGQVYRSGVDLVVAVGGQRVMAFRCPAGSLGSCEREIVAAARLLDRFQIPLSVVSDGKNALVFDTLTGRLLGEGLAAIPTRAQIQSVPLDFSPLPPERRLRESLIFRTYDRERVNAARRGGEV